MAKVESVQTWSLCLTSSKGRKVVKIPSSNTTRQLIDVATKEFKTTVSVLKFGFPPKPIVIDDSTIISSICQNQERIQVEFGTPSKSTATGAAAAAAAEPNYSTSKNTKTTKKSSEKLTQKKSTNKKKKSTSSTTSNAVDDSDTDEETVSMVQQIRNSRPKRRAASKAAAEAMPEIIRAQEEMMKQQQQRQQQKKTTSTTASRKKRSRDISTDSNINSTSSSSRKKQQTTSSKKFTAAAGDGRRLGDGAKIVNPATSRQRAASRKKILSSSSPSSSSSNTDMSEALLGALNDKGTMGQVIRKGMKNAVQASYETTKAFSRLAAIQANSYELLTVDGISLRIRYRGSVEKTRVEELVDSIPRDVLEAVIRAIHSSNQEALRPENLALLSPRVLWSLVYQLPHERTVPGAYAELLPDLDWTFLRRRAQQLSEKALENLRQEQEAKGEESVADLQRAAEAISAVEDAMEHLHDFESTERTAKRAQAALARLKQTTKQKDDPTGTDNGWKLVTPSEPDRDELRSCIQQSPPTNEADIPAIITRLMKVSKIHNWRELANVSDIEKLATELNLPSETIQKWIEKAQDESVEEIIVEICDDNVSVVEMLVEKARTGTPKDLAAWRCIPESLYEQLGLIGVGKTDNEDNDEKDISSSNNSSNNNDNDDTTISLATKITVQVEQLATWSHRSYLLLQEYEWLNWYATPVE